MSMFQSDDSRPVTEDELGVLLRAAIGMYLEGIYTWHFSREAAFKATVKRLAMELNKEIPPTLIESAEGEQMFSVNGGALPREEVLWFASMMEEQLHAFDGADGEAMRPGSASARLTEVMADLGTLAGSLLLWTAPSKRAPGEGAPDLPPLVARVAARCLTFLTAIGTIRRSTTK